MEDTVTQSNSNGFFVSWKWPGEKSAKGEKNGILVRMVRMLRHVMGPEDQRTRGSQVTPMAQHEHGHNPLSQCRPVRSFKIFQAVTVVIYNYII